MKSLWGKFGYEVFIVFKMACPQIWDAFFLLLNEIEDLYI